jgi:hypothetical protein
MNLDYLFTLVLLSVKKSGTFSAREAHSTSGTSKTTLR